MSTFRISATFSKVFVKYAYQDATVVANTIPVALNRGMKEILKRKGIKGRSHTLITLSIQKLDVSDPASAEAAE